MLNRPEYNPKVIGRNLKRLRLSKSLTVEDIRKYLHLGSVQAIYKYENGQSYPQADALLALMQLYGVGVADLIYEQEPTAFVKTGGHLYMYYNYLCRGIAG